MTIAAIRTLPIIQGEHAVVREPGVKISTLLGSCIAVCLHDAERRIGGMNHFLLGEPDPAHKVTTAELQRYGVHAMELLINAMLKAGADRRKLRAHLYGGANIIAGLGGIGSTNAEFTLKFLKTEGIEIGHNDTGGKKPRKLEFMPYDGKIRCTYVSEPVPVALPVRKPAHGGEIDIF